MAAHSDIPFKRLPVKIIGTGSYVPERRLTNADLEKMVDTSHELNARALWNAASPPLTSTLPIWGRRPPSALWNPAG